MLRALSPLPSRARPTAGSAGHARSFFEIT